MWEENSDSINDCKSVDSRSFNALSEEGVEYLVSIMMEPYNKITDPLISQMSSDEDSSFNIPVDRTINDLREIIEKNYSDILKIDFG